MFFINLFLLTIKFLTVLLANTILANVPVLKIFLSVCLFYIGYSLYYHPKPLTTYPDIVKYYKIEEKYTRLAKFIKLRRTLQTYYFNINIFIIIIVLIQLF